MTQFRLLLVCAVMMAVSVTVQSATYSCYSNQTMCLSDLRQLLIDTNRFWFGNSYESSCPGGPESSPRCGNPDTNKKSILSRLLGLNDSSSADWLGQVSQNISLANITFNAPAGNYTGCGQLYEIPAVTDYLVDPLNITRLSSWSMVNTPKVTWYPRTPNTSHILAILDPGNFYNHGLYINCVNGSLDSCVPVRPYFGPLNTHLRENTYIFAVYEQTTEINITAARKFIEGQALIKPAEFIANFTTSVKNNGMPVHAGVMTVVADAYSVQKISDRFFVVNNCPYLISQLDAFQTLVNFSNLSVPWSNSTTTMSLNKNTPYLTSLTTNIDVRYTTEDFSIESCCRNYSVTRGMYIVNPFSDATAPLGNVRNKPFVQLTPIDIRSPTGIADDTYTLFLVDVAPALIPNSQTSKFVTHWLVTNIKNADVNTGDEVAAYFGPNPSMPNIQRTYLFLLLRQPVENLNNSVFSDFCPNGTMRCQINLTAVLDAWHLTDIVGVTWFLAEQDAFAVYRLYTVFGINQTRVCSQVPGYAEPCPSQVPGKEPCPSKCPTNATRGGSQMMNNLVLTLLLGVFISCLRTFQ